MSGKGVSEVSSEGFAALGDFQRWMAHENVLWLGNEPRNERCESCHAPMEADEPGYRECLPCLAFRYGCWLTSIRYADVASTLVKAAFEGPMALHGAMAMIDFEDLVSMPDPTLEF